MDIKLWDHQKKAIEEASKMNYYALFHEMGVGKTCTVINILKNKFNENKKILKTIIFTPPSVVSQFRSEWFKYSKVSHDRVIELKGSQEKRLGTFLNNKNTGTIFITNYEALLMKDLYKEFLKWNVEAVVLDESHRAKNHSTSRAKALQALTNPVGKCRPIVYLLSGTPILNSPLDIFQQAKIMIGGWPTLPYFETREKRHLIDNFYHFRARYFYDANAGMPSHIHFPNFQIRTMQKSGFDAMAEISEIIKRIGSNVTKDDCMDLPEEVTIIRKLGMTPEQIKNYREMKDHLITYINGKECVASIALTKALRLMQIASGFLTVEDNAREQEQVHFKNTPKEQCLKELLEDITPNNKVLVWAVFKNNFKQIREVCDSLKIKYVEVHGEISETKKKESIELFKTDDSIRVFISHPISGGIGLNLTNAPCSIFYSRNFSLEQYLQARGRNHRGQQTQKVTHYDLVCEGTIDEQVVEALSKKEEIGISLLTKV